MKESTEPKGALAAAIADLFPGYFALIMATGIVSIATHLLQMPWIAKSLLVINVVSYAILCVLLSIRLVRFFPNVKSDITDHMRGPGFFTVAAGTCVLGSQLVIVAGEFQAAMALWFVGLALWAVTMYTFFTFVTIQQDKPTLEKGMSGTWLIAAVATQSISVLGTLLSDKFAAYREALLFFTLCMFLVGCMLYLLLITLIFYRFTFKEFTAAELSPPYWINMGAVAITTLAGARLIIAAPEWTFLGEILPFLKGFTLFFWAWGTWWIPLLVVLGFWRHVYMRFPLRYNPQYWGMVFPLGMYTVCTFQLSNAIHFGPLMFVPKYFVYLAITAWIVAFGGMLYNFVPTRQRT